MSPNTFGNFLRSCALRNSGRSTYRAPLCKYLGNNYRHDFFSDIFLRRKSTTFISLFSFFYPFLSRISYNRPHTWRSGQTAIYVVSQIIYYCFIWLLGCMCIGFTYIMRAHADRYFREESSHNSYAKRGTLSVIFRDYRWKSLRNSRWITDWNGEVSRSGIEK